MSGKKHIIVLTEKQRVWLLNIVMTSYGYDIDECCQPNGTERIMFNKVKQALQDTKEI